MPDGAPRTPGGLGPRLAIGVIRIDDRDPAAEPFIHPRDHLVIRVRPVSAPAFRVHAGRAGPDQPDAGVLELAFKGLDLLAQLAVLEAETFRLAGQLLHLVGQVVETLHQRISHRIAGERAVLDRADAGFHRIETLGEFAPRLGPGGRGKDKGGGQRGQAEGLDHGTHLMDEHGKITAFRTTGAIARPDARTPAT